MPRCGRAINQEDIERAVSLMVGDLASTRVMAEATALTQTRLRTAEITELVDDPEICSFP